MDKMWTLPQYLFRQVRKGAVSFVPELFPCFHYTHNIVKLAMKLEGNIL